jgi:hypothetical protein
MSKDGFVQGSSSNRSRITNYQPVEDELDTEDEANKLWKVLGIVAERKNKYKIRWEGDDPATGKPWPNSWTMKEDVTSDVIEEWLALPEEERKRRTEEEDRFEKEEKKKASKSARKSKGARQSFRDAMPRDLCHYRVCSTHFIEEHNQVPSGFDDIYGTGCQETRW